MSNIGKKYGVMLRRAALPYLRRLRKQGISEATLPNPLEVMLGEMFRNWTDALENPGNQLAHEKAFKAARDCAPFIHPRLANVDASVTVTNQYSRNDVLEAAKRLGIPEAAVARLIGPDEEKIPFTPIEAEPIDAEPINGEESKQPFDGSETI